MVYCTGLENQSAPFGIRSSLGEITHGGAWKRLLALKICQYVSMTFWSQKIYFRISTGGSYVTNGTGAAFIGASNLFVKRNT